MKLKVSANMLALAEETYDFSSVSFMEPNPDRAPLFAKSRDYCVIMHLSEDIKNLIVSSKFNDSNVQELFMKESQRQRR